MWQRPPQSAWPRTGEPCRAVRAALFADLYPRGHRPRDEHRLAALHAADRSGSCPERPWPDLFYLDGAGGRGLLRPFASCSSSLPCRRSSTPATAPLHAIDESALLLPEEQTAAKACAHSCGPDLCGRAERDHYAVPAPAAHRDGREPEERLTMDECTEQGRRFLMGYRDDDTTEFVSDQEKKLPQPPLCKAPDGRRADGAAARFFPRCRRAAACMTC